MATFALRPRAGYLFAALVVAHVVLISTQVSSARGVPMAEEITFGFFAEIQRAASYAIGGVRSGWGSYLALKEAQTENEALRQAIAELQIRLQQEQALAAQAGSLQRLLDLRSRTRLETTGATVIGGSASPTFRTITVDKGREDGLAPDMAVIAPEGVVGRVITPTNRAAKVQLLIDRNAAAGAMVERSRAQGIVVGGGDDGLLMDYVSGTADVAVGDRVVTSGIDGIYPKGFAIGQIESIERGAGMYKTIHVRPFVQFSSIEDVLVVLTRPETGTGGAPPGADER